MLDTRQTIANLVTEHAEFAPIFQKHRIDFCCHGEVSLDAACAKAGVDLVALTDELVRAAARDGESEVDPRTLSTAALVAHIIARHHEYLRQTLPFVRTLATKVRQVHGEHNPKLVELNELVAELCDDLVPHLDMEETSLFPALILKDAKREIDDEALARELATMNDEHLAVGELLDGIRGATEDYAVPDWACGSYRRLFAELERLEGDVLKHVHLENHVLKPRFADA